MNKVHKASTGVEATLEALMADPRGMLLEREIQRGIHRILCGLDKELLKGTCLIIQMKKESIKSDDIKRNIGFKMDLCGILVTE